MKKIVSLLVISMFLLSGAVLASVSTTKTAIEKTIHFSDPSVAEDGKYVAIKVANSNNVLKNEKYPMMPYRTETMEFPVGTKIVGVEVQHSEPIEMELSKKVVPTPLSTPVNMQNVEPKIVEGKIYRSGESYPDHWYNWNVGVGLDGYEHVFYLSVQLYPAYGCQNKVHSPGKAAANQRCI